MNKEYRRWVGSTRKKQADFEDSFILTLLLVLLQADVAWLTKDDGQVSEKKRATQTHHWSTPNIFLDSPHGSTLSSFLPSVKKKKDAEPKWRSLWLTSDDRPAMHVSET